MPVGIEFRVLGETQLQRSLLRFSARWLNATPAMLAIMKYLERLSEEQFESEGASGSGGWAPLAPATIEFKQRNGYPLEILHRTLLLKNSLTKWSAPGAERHAGPHGFTWGSSVRHGIFHQDGAEANGLPQRRPVDITASQRDDIVKILQGFLVRGIVKVPA